MSYKINKTDGSLLIDLANATVDSETTNLTLVGKGYAGYGEIFNENFVKLLENFSSVTAPTTPLTGQLWYDSSESRLKVYNGASWKSTDTVTVSNVQPPMVSGDLWIDSNNEQLYFTQGTDVLLAGPIYTRTQQLSGLDVKDITDTSGIKHTIVRQFIGGTLMAVHAKSSIVYDATNSTNLSILPGYTSPINVGINVSPAQTGFAFNGTATTSKNIISSAGVSYTPEDLLRLALDNTTAGKLHIKNDNGLTVGVDSDYVTEVGTVVTGSTTTNTIINRVQTGGSDWRLQIKQGTVIKTAISVENSTTRIGFWNEAPEYSLDLTGNLRVTGDVIVEGTLSASTFSSLDGYSNTSVDTHLNQTNPTSGYVLSWNGTDYAWVAQSSDYSNTSVDTHLNQTNPTSGYVLSWNGTDYAWTLNGTGTGIGDIVDDATPQLGGDLDVNGNKITSNSNTDVIIEPNGTGNFVVETDTLHLKNTNNGNIGTRLFLDHITTTPDAADNNSQILVRTNEAGVGGAVGALATTFRIIVTSPDNTAGASTGKAVFDIKEDATSSPITYMDLDGDQEEIYFYKDIQVSGNITVTGTVNTAGGLKVSGNIEEKFTTLTSAASTVTHDCSTASLFYHTGATGDFTVNLTNINSTVEYAKGISVVVNQSSTAYMPTALQIGGAAQTINWQGGSAPSGTANGVDNVSFTIINDGGTYVVLGQAVAYS